MTASKWSMMVLILVFLVVAGCVGETALSPTPPPVSSPSSSLQPSSSSPSSSALTILSIMDGEVLVMKEGSTAWSEAVVGMILEPGDRIKAGADGHATITFFEGSTVELDVDTEIAFEELGIAADTGSTIIKLRQEIGKTRSRVEKLVDPASRYEVETPAGAAVVRGSDGDVIVHKNGIMEMYNREGEWWLKWLLCGQWMWMSLPEGKWVTKEPGRGPVMGRLLGSPPPPVAPGLGFDWGGSSRSSHPNGIEYEGDYGDGR